MNDRERFRATMHYEPRDRAPVCDFSFWHETLIVWQDQGLPNWVDRGNSDGFFGMDCFQYLVPIHQALYPTFEHKVLEDRGDHELLQQSDGVTVVRRKFMGSIPHPESHLLQDRASWEKHFKPRLQPDTPERFPADWNERVQAWRDPSFDKPLTLPGGSLYGWLRNWMGMENLSYLVYDDPALFEEMVETITDVIVATLEKALAEDVRYDACSLWEDMCYNGGPLLSPEHFKRYLVPQYRRITDLLYKHGVDVIYLDCDGRIDELIPLWLEGGVNTMFPLEVGTWGADPVEYRKQYGKDLLLMGGFDKKILASNRAAIEAEVHRLAPLVEEGGYIGFCDHRVPPDVPLAHYVYYLETVRKVWAQGVNLKPMKIHASMVSCEVE